jgi:high affinity Mn2+ porin
MRPGAAMVFGGLLIAGVLTARARPMEDSTSCFSLHFQQTVIVQGHGRFRSPYEGVNSQRSSDSTRISVTSTIFLGVRTWTGGAVFINPELSAGSGMGNSLGIAGFPNGETYRIGSPAPAVEISRIYLRQDFPLGSAVDESLVADGPNQLAGCLPSHRLTLTAGKFGIADIFDQNGFSHDPRTQFMNWSIMSNGAWDFPADTRGYTLGFVLEYVRPDWSLRLSSVMVPKEANGMTMDTDLGKAHSETLELELPYDWDGRKGTFRAGSFLTHARMGNYRNASDVPAYERDITQTRLPGRTKYGPHAASNNPSRRRLDHFFELDGMTAETRHGPSPKSTGPSAQASL